MSQAKINTAGTGSIASHFPMKPPSANAEFEHLRGGDGKPVASFSIQVLVREADRCREMAAERLTLAEDAKVQVERFTRSATAYILEAEGLEASIRSLTKETTP